MSTSSRSWSRAQCSVGRCAPRARTCHGDILSLYTQVVNADAAPTRVQQSAAESLFQEWKGIAAASAKLSQSALARLNQALSSARLPTLAAMRRPRRKARLPMKSRRGYF